MEQRFNHYRSSALSMRDRVCEMRVRVREWLDGPVGYKDKNKSPTQRFRKEQHN